MVCKGKKATVITEIISQTNHLPYIHIDKVTTLEKDKIAAALDREGHQILVIILAHQYRKTEAMKF